MKISKKDALIWFRFFAELPEDEPPQLPRHLLNEIRADDLRTERRLQE